MRAVSLVEFHGNDVLVHLPKAILVLTRAQFKAALKRGKAWRRHQALMARRPLEDNL